MIEVIRNQGFGAIRGVGGYVDFAADGFQLIHRTAIYAPPPYKNAMEMFVLPNDKNFTPQPWVPRDVATCSTLYLDILNAFDHFGPLFDELFGEGEKGVWDQVLESLKKDPNGPKIDLRADLIKHLGKRVTMVTDYQAPITTSSERLLFAIETTNQKAVALAVEKSMKNDPTVKRREYKGHVIWEIVEEEQPKVPSISLGEIPSVGPKVEKEKEKGKGKGKAKEAIPSPDQENEAAPEEEKEGAEKEAHFLPHGAVTVADGQLFVASHIDFLKKILDPLDKKDTLAASAPHKQVTATIEKIGLEKRCGGFFSRTDEELYPTYELIRQGKMPESESLLGRTLNSLSGAAKKGVMRPQRINGKNLPDYNKVVRPALGLSGVAGVSEPDGWFIKGFLLPKPAAAK